MSTSEPSPPAETAPLPEPVPAPQSEEDSTVAKLDSADGGAGEAAGEPEQLPASDPPAVERSLEEDTAPGTPAARAVDAAATSADSEPPVAETSSSDSAPIAPPPPKPSGPAALLAAMVGVLPRTAASRIADIEVDDSIWDSDDDLVSVVENEKPSAVENEKPSAVENEKPAAAENEKSAAAENEKSAAAENEKSAAAENEKPAEATAKPSLLDAPWSDADDVDDFDDENSEDLTGELQNQKPVDALGKPVLRDPPWSDVDDLEDDEDDEDDEDQTSVVAEERAATASTKVPGDRPWKDVDDLEDDDDDDDPSEYLPTRLMGAPAPTVVGQRTLVPPPPSRGAVRSRAPGSSLPAIPAPPTLPGNLPQPSVPPVAFDWILERTGRRAGSLTVILAGVVVLIVGIVPLVALGALVSSLFADDAGSLVVTVAGPNHAPVASPLVLADDIPRCKESPCRIAKLPAGTHLVRVTAPGYQAMAPRAVAVKENDETVLHVELAREPVKVAEEAPVHIDLDDPSVKVETLPRSAAARAAPSPGGAAPVANRAGSVAPAAAAGEPGTLNISSTPPSNAVLDGRPLGITPRSGIRVKPGAHQVVFIHPKLGRKSARATVKPGSVSNVSVRFR